VFTWFSGMVRREDGSFRWAWLVGCFLVLVACAVQGWQFHKSTYVPLTGDMIHYNHAANELLQRHVLSYWSMYPSAQVMPGYPLFLAACKWIAGTRWIVGHGQFGLPGLRFIVLVQGMLSVVGTLVVYAVARRVCAPLWAGLGALLWTLYLPQAHATTTILTEPLYTFLLWSFMWLALRAAERPTVARWLLVGVGLGACTLVRPTPMPILAIVAVYLWWQWRRARLHLKHAVSFFAASCVGFLICLVPWWIRNWITFHRLILTSDDAGNPLLYGSVPSWAPYSTDIRGLTAQQQEALAVHNIVLGFSQHPLGYLKWYTVDKLSQMFGQPWYPKTEPLQWWANLHVLWVVVGVLGLLLSLRCTAVRWLTAVMAFLVVLQLPFIPLPRYVLPVMPVVFIGTGRFGQQLTTWCRRFRTVLVTR
jgi:Dolichyl-phosphate-mannose-protein mannosyltransferase